MSAAYIKKTVGRGKKSSLSIAFAAPYVPPAYIAGGEAYVYHLVKELVKLGINIDLFTTAIPTKTEEWSWDHVNLYESSPLFKVGKTPVMPSLPLKMIGKRKYDLIHANFPSGFVCDVSAFVSSIQRKPLVITYHCDVLPLNNTSKAYNLFLKLYTLRHASRIIATTKSYVETSPILKSFVDKVELVPMGVDLTRFYVNKRYQRETKQKHGIKEGEKVILFVGGLDHYHRSKRVDLLIRVMQDVSHSFNDFVLLIVGEGDLRSDLENLCKGLNLGDKVIFTGYVSNEDLPKYYCAADLFVLPSLTREEAFGIVLIEAAACGAVPICFNIPGPGWVCRDLGGFVVPIATNHELYSNLLKTVLQALTTNLEHKSKTCVQNVKKYDWSNIAKKTLEIYEELV